MNLPWKERVKAYLIKILLNKWLVPCRLKWQNHWERHKPNTSVLPNHPIKNVELIKHYVRQYDIRNIVIHSQPNT